jgi:hypothetical protein
MIGDTDNATVGLCLVSDVWRKVCAAVQRRRERAQLARAYPRAWVDHLAELNRPTVTRRQQIPTLRS